MKLQAPTKLPSKPNQNGKHKPVNGKATARANHDKDVVLRAAHNQWRSILEHFGIPSELLTTGGPCPKCQGKDRFDFSNVNGNGAVHCRHCASKANGSHVANGIGAVAWWKNWAFHEACNQVGEHLNLTPSPPAGSNGTTSKQTIAPIEVLDRVYRAFLGGLTLSDEHRKHLQEVRRRSDEQIAAEGYKTLSRSTAMSGIESVYNWCEHDDSRCDSVLATPGFRTNENNELQCYTGHGGILVPVRDVNGKINALHVRLDKPTKGGKYRLFSFKGQGTAPIHHVGAFESGCTVRVGEGALKAIISESITGTPAIFSLGVDHHKRLTEAISNSKASRVLIAFDSDWCHNKAVAAAVIKIAQFCRSQDISYAIETWPTEFKGIDDLLIQAPNQAPDHIDLEQFQEQVGMAVDKVVLAYNDGRVLARAVLNDFDSEKVVLRFQECNSQWWIRENHRYEMLDEETLSNRITSIINECFDREFARLQEEEFDSKRVSKIPSNRDNANALRDLRSLCAMRGKVSLNTWLPDVGKDVKPRRLLAMKNGLLDLDQIGCGDDSPLESHSENWFSTVAVSYGYDPDATCPRWEKFIETAMEGDLQLIHLLQEWAGYLLEPNNARQKFLAVQGPGGNGKTVYFAGLLAMLGESNISTVALKDFSNDFVLTETIGKLANICNEVGSGSFEEGVVKTFSGGDRVTLNRKFKAPISMVPTARLMLSWNDPPKVVGKSSAIWRRLLLVPFDRPVPASERVLGMASAEYWADEAPGILNWAIAGLQRLRGQDGFTVSEASNELASDYRLQQNHVARFASEFFLTAEECAEEFPDLGLEIPPLKPADAYRDWCIENEICLPSNSYVFERFATWANEKGIEVTDDARFFQSLKSSFPGIQKCRKTTKDPDGTRPHFYCGIRVHPEIDFRR